MGQAWQPLLHWTLQLIQSVTAAGSVALFVKVGDSLHCMGSSAVRGGLARGKQSIKIGTGLTGHAAREGRVIRVKDALADDRFDGSADMNPGDAPGAMLLMPSLDNEQHVTAVMRLCNKTSPQGRAIEFNMADVSALRVLLVDTGVVFAATQEETQNQHDAGGVSASSAAKAAVPQPAVNATEAAPAEAAPGEGGPNCSCEQFRETCQHQAPSVYDSAQRLKDMMQQQSDDQFVTRLNAPPAPPGEEPTRVTTTKAGDHEQCQLVERLLKVKIASLQKELGDATGVLDTSFGSNLARTNAANGYVTGETIRVVDPKELVRLQADVQRLEVGNSALQQELLDLQLKVLQLIGCCV